MFACEIKEAPAALLSKVTCMLMFEFTYSSLASTINIATVPYSEESVLQTALFSLCRPTLQVTGRGGTHVTNWNLGSCTSIPDGPHTLPPLAPSAVEFGLAATLS